MSQYITKTNISDPKNLNVAGKDNVYIQKKRKRSLSDKKAYFKAEKISALHKMQFSHDNFANSFSKSLFIIIELYEIFALFVDP